jgi:molecular chaperone Hsp33
MNYLIKALTRNEKVRVYITNTTEVTNEAIRLHDLWPSAASVLGKTMTIALIMGAMLKGEEALTIKIDGNGPIGNVIVDSDSKGNVKGYVDHPHVHFSNKQGLDDKTTLGYNGYIDVIKDLKLKDLYSSTIPLQTGDLARDFSYYFAFSEQTPSLVALSSTINEDNTCKVSGGIIIQLMPGAQEEDIVFIESKFATLTNFSNLLLEYPNLEDILKLLFSDDYVLVDSMNVRFHCDCSKEKFSAGIATLGKDEIEDIIEKDKQAEVICHYCNTQYLFNEDELKNILKGIKK